jgi:anthranilate synthase component 1
VHHGVAEISARLRGDVGWRDLLAATFPPGSVTGAPKVRAMQIISALEPHRRGPYAGAVGYLGTDGTLDTCIALRTIQLKDGVATLQAGAGIVADSDPAEEHRECLRKIAALQRAVDLADAGGYGR